MKLFKHRPTEGYQTKTSIINRRKAILTTAKYTFFGLIGLRLLWLQVFQRNKYSVLSDRIREFLDEFLMLEAFKCISNEKFNIEKFRVYKDPVITVHLDKKDQKIFYGNNLN